MKQVVQLTPVELPKAPPLTSELKDFIDRTIVPVLVKKYLAEIELAKTPAAVALFYSSTDTTRKVRT
jgi:hypothetical protein